MAKIIEIVGTDYYDCANPHVVLLDGVDIKEEHSNYKKYLREGELIRIREGGWLPSRIYL